MINDTYFLWEKEEYTYPVKGEFIPNIVTYIHENNNELRPAMIVVPGGGYCVVSDTEAEIVAKEFYNKGYNRFVVTYTTNLLMTIPLKFQPLKDLSKAVMFVRKNAESCKKHGVTFEHHVFGNGGHGMSLANEDWASGNFGGDYTMQQYYENIQFMIDNNMELPSPFNMIGEIPKGARARDILKEEIKKLVLKMQRQPDKGIAVWPELAHNWLKKVLSI